MDSELTRTRRLQAELTKPVGRRARQAQGFVDVGGVYDVLRNLEKTPSERLRAALDHRRLFGPVVVGGDGRHAKVCLGRGRRRGSQGGCQMVPGVDPENATGALGALLALVAPRMRRR